MKGLEPVRVKASRIGIEYYFFQKEKCREEFQGQEISLSEKLLILVCFKNKINSMATASVT